MEKEKEKNKKRQGDETRRRRRRRGENKEEGVRKKMCLALCYLMPIEIKAAQSPTQNGLIISWQQLPAGFNDD